MAVPTEVRKSICKLLWEQADQLDWVSMNIHQKSQQYKLWAQDESIGAVLSRYMPLERVHPYIKDSLLKPYAKSKKIKSEEVFRLLSINESNIKQEYIKPLGVRLDDGRIICWGRAIDWKIILLAIFERYKEDISYTPYAAILTEANGKFSSETHREVITEAGTLLGISKILYKK